MKKGISVDGLLLILTAFLIICSAPAMAGKIDPLLVALRAQQNDTAKVFIGSDGKEYISSHWYPTCNVGFIDHPAISIFSITCLYPA